MEWFNKAKDWASRNMALAIGVPVLLVGIIVILVKSARKKNPYLKS